MKKTEAEWPPPLSMKSPRMVSKKVYSYQEDDITQFVLYIEFLFFTTVFKTEEKKIVGHARFDQVTAQYW
jgi:hypothetical protein